MSGFWNTIKKFLLDFSPALKQIINFKNYILDFSKFQGILTWLYYVSISSFENNSMMWKHNKYVARFK